MFEQFSLHFDSKIKIISDAVTKNEQCLYFYCAFMSAFFSLNLESSVKIVTVSMKPCLGMKLSKFFVDYSAVFGTY